MKYALFFGLCLAFAFVVQSFEEDEFLKEEDAMEKRHLYKGCETDSNCDSGECCYKSWFSNWCMAQQGKDEYCNPNWECFYTCKDPLKCRRKGSGFTSYHTCQ